MVRSWWWGGNNITIEENELSALSGSTVGPGLYFQYTQTDDSVVGCTPRGAESCVAFDNIIIRNNYIHDTFGEALYMGGCGNNPGCISHSNVVIEGNRIENAARWGGEGDYIDIKDGHLNTIVRNNTIICNTSSRAA